MTMPRPRAEDLPYRRCVGAMVLNRENLVWAGRRIPPPGSEYSGSEKLWQMPQGGIDEGEEPLAAAYRELHEETGISSVTLLAEAPDWIHYDLPEDLLGIGLKGKYRGQAQKWYAFRFEGSEDEIAINPPPGGHTAEFDAWEWKTLASLPDLIVPFKRVAYEKVIETFGHLVPATE